MACCGRSRLHLPPARLLLAGTECKDTRPRLRAALAKKLVPALSGIGELSTHVNAGWPTALTVNSRTTAVSRTAPARWSFRFQNGDLPVPLQSSNDGNWEGTWQNTYGDAGQVTITIVASDPSRSLSGSVTVGRQSAHASRSLPYSRAAAWPATPIQSPTFRWGSAPS